MPNFLSSSSKKSFIDGSIFHWICEVSDKGVDSKVEVLVVYDNEGKYDCNCGCDCGCDCGCGCGCNGGCDGGCDGRCDGGCNDGGKYGG